MYEAEFITKLGIRNEGWTSSIPQTADKPCVSNEVQGCFMFRKREKAMYLMHST